MILGNFLEILKTKRLLPFIKKNNPLTSRNICTLENNFVVINQSECATTRILDINKTILSQANLVNIFHKGFFIKAAIIIIIPDNSSDKATVDAKIGCKS